MKPLFKNYTTLFALTILISACAKQRDIEVLKLGDSKPIEKAALLGDPSQGGTTWIYKVTTLKTSLNGGFTFAGFQSDAKVGHFELSETQLKFVNDVTMNQKPSGAVAKEVLNSWDISHYDVKLAESDGNVTNKEIEDNEKKWNEKRYVKIDFAKANISEAATFPYTIDMAESFECWSKKSSEIVDNSLEVSGDYITFVVESDYQQNTLCNQDLRRAARGDYTFTAQFRYSFKKLVANNYKPLVTMSVNGSVDPMQKMFGYFQTYRELTNPANGLTQVSTLVNRWDPEKEHHFFFTKDFPQEYKWMFNDPKQGVFVQTNKMLEKKGLKARFYVHENSALDGKTKEFGDIRYSFVHFVTEVDPDAPLGYGPSDANPFTGEIVSANLILWTGFVKNYVKRLKDTFGRQPTKFSKSTLFNKMKQTLANAGNDLSTAKLADWSLGIEKDTGASNLYFDALPSLTYGYPGWAMFSGKEPFGFDKLMNFRSDETLARYLGNIQGGDEALAATTKAKSTLKSQMDAHLTKPLRKGDTCVTPITEYLGSLSSLVINHKNAEDIVDTLLFRVAIHEFGHNLGLRHNFYGTVDSRNFLPEKPAVNRHGEPLLDPKGKPMVFAQMSSSVMDYLTLEDEIFLHHEWEPYDEAAILYSYSGGAIKPKRSFLYCTDEHTVLNALCNRFDHGSSPSEVLMSLIESYDESYWVSNYRMDRAYWSVGAYESRVFGTMFAVKKLLMMQKVALNSGNLVQTMESLGYLNNVPDRDAAIRDHVNPIMDDIKRTMLMSLAFYNGVIQQDDSERAWFDNYDDFTGEQSRIGIFYDKLYAMLFLAGDDGFTYNPSKPSNYLSYLSYKDVPELAQLMDYIFKATMTERVAMPPWFIGFGRAMYAMAATNPENQDNMAIIDQIRVSRYNAEQLKASLGLSVSDIDKVRILERSELTTLSDPYFDGEDDAVGIAEIRGHYYVVSRTHNPYAFSIVKKLADTKKRLEPLYTGQADLQELYHLYMESLGDIR